MFLARTPNESSVDFPKDAQIAAEVPAETARVGDQKCTEFSDAQPQLSKSGFIPVASSNHINHPIQIPFKSE